jgi:hypothetical protein
MFAILFPVAVFVLDVLFVLLVSGGFPFALYFVDFASLLAVPVVGWLSATAGFGLRRSLAAWKAPLDPGADAAALRGTLAWTGSLAGWIAAYGAFAVTVGVILSLSNVSDPARVGRNLGVSLVSLLYASASAILLVLPFRTVASRRLSELP